MAEFPIPYVFAAWVVIMAIMVCVFYWVGYHYGRRSATVVPVIAGGGKRERRRERGSYPKLKPGDPGAPDRADYPNAIEHKIATLQYSYDHNHPEYRKAR